MESQNTVEDSKNREDVSDSRGFTVLLSFPSLEIIKSFLISYWSEMFSLYEKSFIDQVCSVKMAGFQLRY